jgi:adenine/guanine phosphoribosyltransferase-like PRPP-binding protein
VSRQNPSGVAIPDRRHWAAAQSSDHYDSTDVRVPGTHPPPQRITLVDDVITRGSTFVGIFPRLQAAYPEVTIVCFALVRTVSTGEVEMILAPTEGTITYREGQLVRQP